MSLNLSLKKILVVDDFPEMRSAMKRMLLSLGAKDVDAAKNGREALALITRKAYDLVLCDYNLGEGKDGQQVLEEAKHKELVGFSTVFIMVTAENAMDTVMAVVEYGPDDYLTKPFAKDVLASRVEKAFNKKMDLNEIESAMAKKDYRRALELCDEKMAGKPRNLGELLRLKGEILIKVGRYPEAEKLYEGVLAIRSVPWAELGLGRAKFLATKYLEARDVLSDLSKKKRDYVQAYDWLAKTQEEVGATREAQATLEAAIELSPKAIQRQKALAQVAMKNEDFQAAEKAFRKTVFLGKESIYRDPADYAGLAKVLTINKSSGEAMKVLNNAKQEFQNDRAANLQIALAEGDVMRRLEREKEANDAYGRAMEIHETVTEDLPYQVSVDAAKAAFLIGDSDKGSALMRDIVLNYSEDPRAMAAAQHAFEEAGLGADGKDLITAVKGELVKLNNQGVQLVKEGKLEDATRFFLDAVKGMPKNKTANLNAAQVMLMSMQKSGPDNRYLYKVRECLDRAREIDPNDKQLQKLSDLFFHLSGQH
ncbi:response regulator [Endothiovibrio diazotrophicus]